MNSKEIKRAFRQAIVIGLINLVLTFVLWFMWSDIISDFRSGETTTSRDSGGIVEVMHVTWKEEPVHFAVVMVLNNLTATFLSGIWLLLTLVTCFSGVPDTLTWIRTAGGKKKLCTACKIDCTDAERYQDNNGDYFCKVCYESRCMFCGCDCSDIERVNDNEGHLLCPSCYEKMLHLDQAVVELQAKADKASARNAKLEASVFGSRDRLFRLLDIQEDDFYEEHDPRRFRLGIRGWLQGTAIALLLVAILWLFGYFGR